MIIKTEKRKRKAPRILDPAPGLDIITCTIMVPVGPRKWGQDKIFLITEANKVKEDAKMAQKTFLKALHII
jgi:hypothetical protein